jgi:hypothetical protein
MASDHDSFPPFWNRGVTLEGDNSVWNPITRRLVRVVNSERGRRWSIAVAITSGLLALLSIVLGAIAILGEEDYFVGWSFLIVAFVLLAPGQAWTIALTRASWDRPTSQVTAKSLPGRAWGRVVGQLPFSPVALALLVPCLGVACWRLFGTGNAGLPVVSGPLFMMACFFIAQCAAAVRDVRRRDKEPSDA